MPEDGRQPAPVYSIPRRHPRYQVDLSIKVTVGRTHDFVRARSCDFSECGLALFTPLEIAIGERVQLEFTPPYSQRPVRISAIVRNRVGYRHGLEYVDLTPASREAILRTCKTLSLMT